MTDKETLREAVAMIVGKHIYGETRGRTYLHVTRPCADEILATMFERLRTPSETVLDAGWSSFENAVRKKKPWYEVMASALHGTLTAFQQENSDG